VYRNLIRIGPGTESPNVGRTAGRAPPARKWIDAPLVRTSRVRNCGGKSKALIAISQTTGRKQVNKTELIATAQGVKLSVQSLGMTEEDQAAA
jgi:hypothetical protein